ncbi:aspartate:proton symporter, partial [Staphylococcus aureus]
MHFTNDVGPFVGLAGALGIFWLVKLLLIDAAVSPLGCALVYMTSTSRIIYAMGCNYYISTIFSRVNK